MPAGANVIGSAWMKVGVDPAGVTRGSNLAGKSLIGLGGVADKTYATLMKFAGAYVGFTALTKAIGGSTRAFVGFNEALRETHTLQLTTWENMKALGEQVRSLARDFPDMATVAQQAMYEINSAVFFGAEALEILETSLEGAAAGITDVQTTANVLTTVLNAFNMSGYEASKVMDLFFTTIRIGKTRLPELTSQFGRLAGIAGPVGTSLSDLTAAISFLTRRGLETRWAITALRQVHMQLIKPTQNLAKAISDLGYTSGAAMIKAIGFSQSLSDIVDWAKRSGVEIEQLFTNIRAVMAVLPMASALTGKKGYAWDLEQMANSAGAAQVAFAKMEKSWAFQLGRLKSLFNDLGITIGETFVPVLRTVVTVGTAAANALRPLVKLFEALGGGYFIAIASGIGVLTGAIWLLTKAYSALSISMASALVMGTLGQINIGARLGSMLYGLGGGSMLRGFGAALGIGAGISLGIKGIIDFDLELGEVSGMESVKRGLFDAFKAILGGAIAGALLGGLAGAAIGVAIVAGVLTIKIIHEIVTERKATFEEAKIAAREAVVSFPGISLLREQLVGDVGLGAYARELVRANEEIENTTVSFDAMTDVLRDFYTATTKWTLFGPIITGWSRATLDAFEGQEALTGAIIALQSASKETLETISAPGGLTEGITDLSLAFREFQPPQTIAGLPLPSGLPPPPQRPDLEAWWDPLAQAADMIVSGAGQLVDAFKSAIDAFEDEDWAGLASSVISMIKSVFDMIIAALEREKERLEEEARRLERVLYFWTESLMSLVTTYGNVLSAALGDLLGPLSGLITLFTNTYSQLIEMAFARDKMDRLRIGMDLWFSLITGLVSSFMNLLKQSEAYSAFQQEMSGLWKAVADLFGMFLWPLVAAIKALKGFLGIVDETSKELASLNIPIGFKAERIRYAAITPGVPAVGGAAGYAIPAWAVAVGDELANAIMRMLERFGISSWTDLLDAAKDAATGLWNWIVNRLPEIMGSITSAIEIAAAWVANNIPSLIDLVKQGVNWIIHNLPGFITNLTTFFDDLIDIGQSITSVLEEIDFDDIGSMIKDAISAFGVDLGSIELPQEAYDKLDEVTRAIDRITDAIDFMKKALVYAMAAVAGAIVGALAASNPFLSWAIIPAAAAGAAIGLGAAWIADVLGGFAMGGIVPGPIGAPQLAVVHGGEEILRVGHPANTLNAGGGGDLHVYTELDGKIVSHAVVENFRDISYRKTGRSYSSVAINER